MQGVRDCILCQVLLAGCAIGRNILGARDNIKYMLDASTKEWFLIGIHFMPILYIALLCVRIDDIGFVYVSITTIMSLTIGRKESIR